MYCFWAGLDGPTPGSPRPPTRRVAGLGDVVDLAFSEGHRVGYAVLRSGSVVAFQPKQEQRDPRMIEVAKATIAGLSGVAQIVTSGGAACARRTNGSVVCFKTAPLFDDGGVAKRGAELRPAIAATKPSLVMVKDVADVVDLGKAHDFADVAARTRRGEVILIQATDAGFRAVAQPGLHGAVAMSHHGQFFAVMPDGTVVSPVKRDGSRSHEDGVWILHRREDLGPAIAVESNGNACIVRPSGKVGCWGSNEGGACGRMDRLLSAELLPVKLPAN